MVKLVSIPQYPVDLQINIEYNVSYVYHSMYSYFARDNVGLPGIAAFFKKESAEERDHAELLMDFQVLRGGRVALQVGESPFFAWLGSDMQGHRDVFVSRLLLSFLPFVQRRNLHRGLNILMHDAAAIDVNQITIRGPLNVN
jgi:ferritin heavy chain